MTDRICSIPGCPRKVQARGWCGRHYQRARKHGDPLGGGGYHEVKNPKPQRPIRERLMEKVAITGDCWEWQGARDRDGYGQMVVQHDFTTRAVKAHRASYEAWHPTTGIADGLVVMHTCDNPPCVNPAHLRLGTHADNSADRDAKGRGRAARGSARPEAKLTEADVLAIRADNRLQREIAADYGVSHSTIGSVKSFKNWKHV